MTTPTSSKIKIVSSLCAMKRLFFNKRKNPVISSVSISQSMTHHLQIISPHTLKCCLTTNAYMYTKACAHYFSPNQLSFVWKASSIKTFVATTALPLTAQCLFCYWQPYLRNLCWYLEEVLWVLLASFWCHHPERKSLRNIINNDKIAVTQRLKDFLGL